MYDTSVTLADEWEDHKTIRRLIALSLCSSSIIQISFPKPSTAPYVCPSFTNGSEVNAAERCEDVYHKNNL